MLIAIMGITCGQWDEVKIPKLEEVAQALNPGPLNPSRRGSVCAYVAEE